MKLTNSNIDEYMQYALAKGDSLPQIFDHTQEYARSLDEYSSFYNNYVPLFMYEAMRQKTPIKEFESVVQYIFNNTKPDELNFNRFFDVDDPDVELQEYITYDRFDNDINWWDNMSYFFLDIVDNKLALCNDTLPYLLTILRNIHDNNVEALYEAHFTRFCSAFFYNPNELAPILQAIDNNDAYKKSDGNNYWDFYHSLLAHDLGHVVYNMNDDHRNNIISVLKENISNFDDMFKRVLLDNEDGKIKITLSMLKFINEIGVDQMVEWIQNSLNKQVKSLEEGSFEKYAAYHGIGSSLDIALQETAINGDITVIDVNKSIKENFVALKLLELQVGQDKAIVYIPGFKEYINEQYSIENAMPQKYERVSEFIDCRKIIKYMDYIELGDALPMNTAKVKRPKV